MSLKRGLCAGLLLALAPGSAFASAATSEGSAIAEDAVPTLSALPGGLEIARHGRSVLVDAASARLYMIEDGRVLDSMRVIVGKPSSATPAVRSTLNVATVNPYWNVPTDLARTLIAPRVLKQGESYLRDRGYEVVSNFGAGAERLSPGNIDWEAVADGRATVFVRQRPGPANSMGQIKIGVADTDGIYLHDTPNKDLFTEAERNLSNGCVRLEDAPRLARWLLGQDPALSSDEPEQHVSLPRAVPIVITYLDDRARMQLAALR